MKARTYLRRASADDYRAFYGKEPPEGLVGFCAERDGAMVAYGYVWIDDCGRAWTGVDKACEVPPLMLHRAIADFLAALQQEGIPALYALCDERIPTATRWLTRLGFAVDDALPKVYMPLVEKTLPVWKRVFDNDGMEP
jgi:hypothetical protein